MKFITKVLARPARFLYENGVVFGSIIIVIFVGLIALGVGLGLHQSDNRSSGWTKTKAVVVKAGSKPATDQKKTHSRIHLNSLNVTRTLTVPWWWHDGYNAQIWVKDEKVAFSDPTGPYGDIAVWIVLGVVLGIVFPFLLGRGISHLVTLDDEERSRRRREEDYARQDKIQRERSAQRARVGAVIEKQWRDAPTNLEEFLTLCRKHQNMVVTYGDSIRANMCDFGTQEFCDMYFGGRHATSLEHLTTLLSYENAYWESLFRVVCYVLASCALLPNDFWSEGSRGIQRPYQTLPEWTNPI